MKQKSPAALPLLKESGSFAVKGLSKDGQQDQVIVENIYDSPPPFFLFIPKRSRCEQNTIIT